MTEGMKPETAGGGEQTPAPSKAVAKAAKPLKVCKGTLKFISKTHRSEFNRRRRYEWRTLITTLTFFALVAAAALKQEMPQPLSCYASYAVIVGALVIAAFSIGYLKRVHAANRMNKKIAAAAEDALIDDSKCATVVTAREEVRKEAKEIGGRQWSLIWQGITIVAFALGSTLIVIAHPAIETVTAASAAACKCLPH